MQCTNCGNVILQKKKFCKHCGFQITGLPDFSNQAQDIELLSNPGLVTGDVKLVEAGVSSIEPANPAKLPVPQLALGVISVTSLLWLAVYCLAPHNESSQVTLPVNQSPAHQNQASLTLPGVTRPQPPPPNDLPVPSQQVPSINQNPVPQPGEPVSVQEEIKQMLNESARMVREQNLEGFLSFYTDDQRPYYARETRLLSEVRPAFEKMFLGNRFQDVQLSNFDIVPDPSGTSAVATFDKFFDFRGTQIKQGAVRHRVWLKKLNGTWYITGQKDLQTYYVDTRPNPDVPQFPPPPK